MVHHLLKVVDVTPVTSSAVCCRSGIDLEIFREITSMLTNAYCLQELDRDCCEWDSYDRMHAYCQI